MDKLKEIREIIGTPIMQGKCVAEAQAEGDWLIMFPDGSVAGAANKKKAETACRNWFKENLKTRIKVRAAIGLIEWRT